MLHIDDSESNIQKLRKKGLVESNNLNKPNFEPNVNPEKSSSEMDKGFNLRTQESREDNEEEVKMLCENVSDKDDLKTKFLPSGSSNPSLFMPTRERLVDLHHEKIASYPNDEKMSVTVDMRTGKHQLNGQTISADDTDDTSEKGIQKDVSTETETMAESVQDFTVDVFERGVQKDESTETEPMDEDIADNDVKKDIYENVPETPEPIDINEERGYISIPQKNHQTSSLEDFVAQVLDDGLPENEPAGEKNEGINLKEWVSSAEESAAMQLLHDGISENEPMEKKNENNKEWASSAEKSVPQELNNEISESCEPMKEVVHDAPSESENNNTDFHSPNSGNEEKMAPSSSQHNPVPQGLDDGTSESCEPMEEVVQDACPDSEINFADFQSPSSGDELKKASSSSRYLQLASRGRILHNSAHTRGTNGGAPPVLPPLLMPAVPRGPPCPVYVPESDVFKSGQVQYGGFAALQGFNANIEAIKKNLAFFSNKSSYMECEGVLLESSLFPQNGRYFPEEQVTMDDFIDVGGNGAVFLALDKTSEKTFVVKKIRIDMWQSNEVELPFLHPHPNLVKPLGVLRHKDNVLLLLEYIDGGNLKEIRKRFNSMTETTVKYIVKKCLTFLAYWHSIGVMHLDLKSANIGMTENGVVKIFDCGSAVKLESKEGMFIPKGFVGTEPFMALEVICCKGNCCKADIWSLGATAIELLSGKYPWHDLMSAGGFILYHVAYHGDEIVKYIPETVSKEMCQLIERMCTVDRENRPSAVELLNDPIFNNLENRPSAVELLNDPIFNNSKDPEFLTLDQEMPMEEGSLDLKLEQPDFYPGISSNDVHMQDLPPPPQAPLPFEREAKEAAKDVSTALTKSRPKMGIVGSGSTKQMQCPTPFGALLETDIEEDIEFSQDPIKPNVMDMELDLELEEQTRELIQNVVENGNTQSSAFSQLMLMEPMMSKQKPVCRMNAPMRDRPELLVADFDEETGNDFIFGSNIQGPKVSFMMNGQEQFFVQTSPNTCVGGLYRDVVNKVKSILDEKFKRDGYGFILQGTGLPYVWTANDHRIIGECDRKVNIIVIPP